MKLCIFLDFKNKNERIYFIKKWSPETQSIWYELHTYFLGDNAVFIGQRNLTKY